MKVISVNQAVEIINSQSGKIYSVVFEKRTTGLDRKMVCRSGVSSHTNGGELRYNPRNHNLLNVFDMQSKGYRSINLEGLKKLKASGVVYAIRQ
jgi:hypothetical protein